MAEALPQISDDLLLSGIIARGGMAVVYRGTDLANDRDVAVKVIQPDGGDTVSRFRREIEIVQTLEHPNTVHVYDAGTTPAGDMYLVMEYLDGEDLRQVIKSSSPVPPREVLYIARDALASIADAHGRGIVHRDIKPGNLMRLTGEDGQSLVKVLDFGVARFDDSKHEFQTMAGFTVGTAEYMSPEQARGEGVDARTDLYGLGIVLIELLVGKPPYRGKTPYQTVIQHVSPEPVPIPEMIKGSSLRDLIQRAVEKDKTERFESAVQMLEAVQECIEKFEVEPIHEEQDEDHDITLSIDSAPADLDEAPDVVEGGLRPHMLEPKVAVMAGFALLAAIFVAWALLASYQTTMLSGASGTGSGAAVETHEPGPATQADQPDAAIGAAVRRVTLDIGSEPEGVTVYLDGELLCTAPCVVEIDRREDVVTLRAELVGHQSQEQPIAPRIDHTFTLRMQPSPP